MMSSSGSLSEPLRRSRVESATPGDMRSAISPSPTPVGTACWSAWTHIRRIGEQPLLGCVEGKPRRWVVERTNAWHNRFRGLLVRWERIGAHYLGLLHLACALIAFRQAL